MSSETPEQIDEVLQDEPLQPGVAAAPRPRPARSALAMLSFLLAVTALAGAGYAIWQLDAASGTEDPEMDRALAELRSVDQRSAAAQEESAALIKDLDTRLASLHSRLESMTSVNNVLREQLLGLAERADVAEQALARLAEARSGSDQVLHLNQADALMSQAQERLLLSADVALAMAALKMADAELAQLGDALYSGVRQRLASEIDALRGTPRVDAAALQADLRELQQASLQLPLRDLLAGEPEPLDDEATTLRRAQDLLMRFVSVRRVDSELAGLGSPLDAAQAREQLLLSLQLAELALARRDRDGWQQALQHAERLLRARFEPEHEAYQRMQLALTRLAEENIAPLIPDIGRAQRELRNLRSAQSLGAAGGGAR